MGMDQIRFNQKLQKAIEKYIKTYNSLLDKIPNEVESKIHQELWKLRSDLELLIIELKFYLEIEDKTEKWQSIFKQELKGTRSKQKAIPILEEYRKSIKEIQTIFSKEPKQIYYYFWKLKEVISAILDAFSLEKIKLINGNLKKVTEDVFKI